MLHHFPILKHESGLETDILSRTYHFLLWAIFEMKWLITYYLLGSISYTTPLPNFEAREWSRDCHSGLRRIISFNEPSIIIKWLIIYYVLGSISYASPLPYSQAWEWSRNCHSGIRISGKQHYSDFHTIIKSQVLLSEKDHQFRNKNSAIDLFIVLCNLD